MLTFQRNSAAGIVPIDLLVVRTISFKLHYGLVILGHLWVGAWLG